MQGSEVDVGRSVAKDESVVVKALGLVGRLRGALDIGLVGLFRGEIL